ncbi:ISSth1, transposase (orf2), IS3 family [Streptococcus sp. HSISS3]|nr:ISSth1, transposase (orf2), IS3 family [Streptococcus sp. HSISS3]
MESWQGIIKEMRAVLYPNVSSFEEMKEAYEKTIHYYLYHDPQERFNGKTPAQVRAEAQENPEQAPYYPIKQSKNIEITGKLLPIRKTRLLNPKQPGSSHFIYFNCLLDTVRIKLNLAF